MAKLSEIMSKQVLTAAADASVAEVAAQMLKGRVGSTCVMQGGWLGGIFTERDVMRAAASGADLTKSAISEWMTKDPITASPDMDSDEAAEIMLSHGFRHLPVGDEKSVTGIVSLRDILSTRIRRPK